LSGVEVSIPLVARIEGEGGVLVRVSSAGVERVEVRVFEAPRYFEAMVVGRRFEDVPDIVSRICGFCSVSHVIASCRALERALDVEAPEEVEALRRVAQLAEWINNHAVHVCLMHMPDYLGLRDSIELMKTRPEVVRDCVWLRFWANKLLSIVGGRPAHIVSMRVGGMHRAVSRHELAPAVRDLGEARRRARSILSTVMDLEIESERHRMEYLTSFEDDRYPVLGRGIRTSRGSAVDPSRFYEVVEWLQVPHSNALHYRFRDGSTYVTGPLARVTLSWDRLDPEVRDELGSRGLEPPYPNTSFSIVARAAEIYHAVLEIDRILTTYREPSKPFNEPRRIEASRGAAVEEAPRGTLLHSYEIDDRGRVVRADIVTPTAQNLAAIEEEIAWRLSSASSRSLEEIKRLVEHVVRNYDPCISCSVHVVRI